MKFKFKLEVLLKQRQIQVDADKKNFADKQNEFYQQEEVLFEMILAKKKAMQDRSKEVVHKLNWQVNVHQLNEFISGQDLRIENQNKRLRTIEKEVEILRQILLKSITEARMVEKLKEKKKDEFIKNMNYEEQKELDEIVSLRYESGNEE
jgi:flagellar protein FliJ